jgi:hypothetical protein
MKQRNYIRHPTNIPIEFTVKERTQSCPMRDVNEAGLCFDSPEALTIGMTISVTLADFHPPFIAEGIVKWCSKVSSGFIIGMAFTNKATQYEVRMVEQICHIESYRRTLLKEWGIELTSSQAAKRWIKKYAAYFYQSSS